MDFKTEEFCSDDFYSMQENEIKHELLLLHNKVVKVISLFSSNRPFALYCYFVLLSQFSSFFKCVYGECSEEIIQAIENKEYLSDSKRIELLKRLFSIIEKDFRFDYDQYMIKLVL